MFLRSYGTLAALARPEALPAPQAVGAAMEAAQAAAQLGEQRGTERALAFSPAGAKAGALVARRGNPSRRLKIRQK